MGSKVKKGEKPSKHTVRFGEVRKERMERFRARRREKGEVISTVDELTCILVDKALDAEGITA